MFKKLIKAITKRNKKVDDICSQFDALQAKAIANMNQLQK